MAIKKNSQIITVGAAAFGNSTALHLAQYGYANMTVFDKQPYEDNHYDSVGHSADAASMDLIKIVRFTHYDSLHTQLAFNTIKEWEKWNDIYRDSTDLPKGLDGKGKLYNKVGYVRYHTTPWSDQPAEVDNFDNLAKLGLAWTQFDINSPQDTFRAEIAGFSKKLGPLKLSGEEENGKPIVDITTGFAIASKATYFAYLARQAGVKHVFGNRCGNFKAFIHEGDTVKGITTLHAR